MCSAIILQILLFCAYKTKQILIIRALLTWQFSISLYWSKTDPQNKSTKNIRKKFLLLHHIFFLVPNYFEVWVTIKEFSTNMFLSKVLCETLLINYLWLQFALDREKYFQGINFSLWLCWWPVFLLDKWK